ncbi:MAG: hypothetical protein HY319_21845 [Armatimonadetes bacterium]|nr:hypothetical protein [Armatimonadota bacterium]
MTSKHDRFVVLVQTEALLEALRSSTPIPPSAAVAMAMEIPSHVLSNDLQELAEQAQELVRWYLMEGPEPAWIPEEILYEEVYEDFVEDDLPYEP